MKIGFNAPPSSPLDQPGDRDLDKQGPLTHQGRPIQFGAEKETNMKSVGATTNFDHTATQNFLVSVIGEITPDLLHADAVQKPKEELDWTDLNDKGKSRYTLNFKATYGRWPIIKVTPNKDYSDLSIEPNGWMEVISSKFESIKDAKVFLQKFGWGHVHTSFMRGATPEVQRAQTAWMRNANLYMFLNALESRGAGNGTEDFWRFAIKGLSIPTEENLQLALEMFQNKTMRATPFSKHLHIGLRASGMYGEPNRIGFEARGGIQDEKERVLDSLLSGLVYGRWGAAPDRWGEDAFKLISEPTNFNAQGKTVPGQFSTLIEKHLAEHPIADLTPADAARLTRLVSSTQFYEGEAPAARLKAFDHRIATPLLELEKLSWLTDDERARVISARGGFIEGLARLDAQKGDRTPQQLAVDVSNLAAEWARSARLAGPFGRWLDGGERQHFFS